MVNSIYQILLLGCNKELLPVVRSKLEKSLSDMQITDESYKFINTETFEEESLGVNPTIALYFTSDVNSDKDINLISTLKSTQSSSFLSLIRLIMQVSCFQIA